MYINSEKHLENLRNGRRLANTKVPCRHCFREFTKANIKRHEKACLSNPDVGSNCPVCGARFFGKGTTCSYACSNTYFRTGPRDIEGGKNYRSICFKYHERKCVICGEKNIVEVHHLDEDHENNEPENLIPLCPTHHQYWHSRFRYLVETAVMEYVANWKGVGVSSLRH